MNANRLKRLEALEAAARPSLPGRLPADAWKMLIPTDARGQGLAAEFGHIRPDWSALVRSAGGAHEPAFPASHRA